MRDLVLFRLVHLGVGSVVALRLEAGVPTKVSGSTWGHDLPGSPAFEEHDVFGAASSLRVPENAHSVSRLVFKVSDEPWQAVGAKVFQKPFDVWACNTPRINAITLYTITQIGNDSPGSPPKALKHKLVSSTMTGPPICLAASRHFSLDTSAGVPWYSGKSTVKKYLIDTLSGTEIYFLKLSFNSFNLHGLETTLKGKFVPSMVTNSSSFLAFPVTKVIVRDICNKWKTVIKLNAIIRRLPFTTIPVYWQI